MADPIIVVGTTTSLTGLTKGTVYDVTVTARRGEETASAAPREFTTTDTVLAAPGNVRLVGEPTATGADIAWDAPATGAPTSYLVQVGADMDSDGEQDPGTYQEWEVPAGTLTHTLTGLAPATTYGATVTAREGAEEAASEVLAVTTTAGGG